MEEYAPNSYRSKEEKKKPDTKNDKQIQKVIQGSVKTKKKGEVRKLADMFISEDIDNVKSYIFEEVLVPAVKKAISDVVTNGIDMILYGEAGRSKRNSASTKVSYGKYYNSESEKKKHSSSFRSSFDYDEIIFETRGDAESVLDAMNEIISTYDVVSVLDLYDLADMPTNNYAANKYGWTDIRGCKAKRVPDGYILELPKAKPIN